MPTSADSDPHLLLDTSVAVALCVSGHEARASALAAVAGSRLGLSGHAAFESFSVLTRLPPPARLSPEAAVRALSANFPHSRFLSAESASELFGRLRSLKISGGSVYDALVGSAAAEHGLPLATCDARALRTYRALEIEVVFVS